MHITISLNGDFRNSHTLFIMADESSALVHYTEFCTKHSLAPDWSKLRIRLDSSRYTWVWPKDVSHLYKSRTARWVHLLAGLELTSIELHTRIHIEDIGYLMGRLRAC